MSKESTEQMIDTRIETDACNFVRTIKRYERKIQRLTRERDSYKESNKKIIKAWKPIVVAFYEMRNRHYDPCPY